MTYAIIRQSPLRTAPQSTTRRSRRRCPPPPATAASSASRGHAGTNPLSWNGSWDEVSATRATGDRSDRRTRDYSTMQTPEICGTNGLSRRLRPLRNCSRVARRPKTVAHACRRVGNPDATRPLPRSRAVRPTVHCGRSVIGGVIERQWSAATHASNDSSKASVYGSRQPRHA